MEKAFAYICTAADTAPRLLKRYCRKVYELGYVPICPKLNDGQYFRRRPPISIYIIIHPLLPKKRSNLSQRSGKKPMPILQIF